MLAGIGCGGSGGSSPTVGGSGSSSPTVVPTTPTAGSVFSPVSPPLSPDTMKNNINRGALAAINSSSLSAAPASGAEDPAFSHPFYIVNGVGLPTPVPPAISAPPPSTAPFALTLNGAAPNGGPNPNGGTGVGLVQVPSSTATPSLGQLWFAVPATTSGSFYLRSAESFSVNTTSNTPNLLVGFGSSSVPLDLGYDAASPVSGYAPPPTAVFFNQQAAPTISGGTADNSAFQTWSYNTSTAQLTNLNANGQLYNASPTAGVGAQSPAPGNQWYFYPNYIVERVIGQPNSNPAFPAPSVATNDYGTTDTAGEQAAYSYISSQILGDAASNTCIYEGNSYSGIRCEYVNLNAGSPLSICASQTLNATQSVSVTNPANKHGYSGTAICWRICRLVGGKTHGRVRRPLPDRVPENGPGAAQPQVARRL